MRVPTEAQYARLRILGSGSMALTPARRQWEAILRHGWVQTVLDDDGTGGLLPPLRITPSGLKALAAAVERYGHPDLGPLPARVSEPPFIAKLRQDLDEARLARDRARTEARAATAQLERVQQALGRAAA